MLNQQNYIMIAQSYVIFSIKNENLKIQDQDTVKSLGHVGLGLWWKSNLGGQAKHEHAVLACLKTLLELSIVQLKEQAWAWISKTIDFRWCRRLWFRSVDMWQIYPLIIWINLISQRDSRSMLVGARSTNLRQNMEWRGKMYANWIPN